MTEEAATRVEFGDKRLSARFWANINVNPETGCWEWNRSVDKGGYGVTKHNGRSSRTHRVTLALRERLDPALQVDHLCRVRHCCNPAHLEQVTVSENSIRGISPELTRARNYARYGLQCPQGHDMSGDNLYFDKRGWRRCHECQRKHCREYQARRYAALRARRELERSA